jgi:hypothetical protein
VLFVKYNQNDKVEEDELSRACSSNGRRENHIYIIYGKARRKDTTRKIKTVDSIKTDLGGVGWSCIDCIIWPRIGTSSGLLSMW